MRITELATEITQTIQQEVETIPSFSSQGSSYAKKGYYEIKNPNVFIPNVTTNQTYPTEGIVRINQWVGGNN
ncbi:TPA: hypothetical protein ACGO5P_001611 [Streptococcus suis]